MKTQIFTLSLIFWLLAISIGSAQSNSLYFFYNPSCVQKFDYERVNTFHDIAYTDYYMSVSNDKKAIFRVKKLSLNKTIVEDIPEMPYMCNHSNMITDDLIKQINNSSKVAYMVIEEGDRYALFEVYSVSVLIENQNGIRYIDNKYGFNYSFNASNPGLVLNEKQKSHKERTIYYQSRRQNSCLTSYNFNAVSRHQEDHIVEIKLISGLGIQGLFTDRGEMRLMMINNTPINDFINKRCNNLVTPNPYPKDQPVIIPPVSNIDKDTVGMSAMEKALWESKRKMQKETPIIVGPNPTINPNSNLNPDILNPSKQVILAGDTFPGGYYIVKQKESLYSISAKFGISINRLVDINKLPGYALGYKQKLKVVDDGTVATTKRNPLIKTNLAAKTKTTIHVVQQGQTLYAISQIYGITLPTLYRLNKQLKNQDIDINQQLVVRVVKI
jgi:LysM repeat protein